MNINKVTLHIKPKSMAKNINKTSR